MSKQSWMCYLRSFALFSATAIPCLAVAQEAIVERTASEEVSEPVNADSAVKHFTILLDEVAINENVASDEGIVEETPRPSEYWIGVQLEEPSNLLKSQLKLEDGIVVVEVFDDSPAKKAGIEINDILLRVGDKPIAGPTTLIQAIDAAKEEALDIELLRGGERKKISVTAIKRPKADSDAELTLTETRTPEQLRAEMNRLDEALKALEAARGSTDRPLRFSFVHPQAGLVPSSDATRLTRTADIPENVTIQVRKTGNKPASITVQRDGKTWETTEDKLLELPDEIRGNVLRVFARVLPSNLAVHSLKLPPGHPPHAATLSPYATARPAAPNTPRYVPGAPVPPAAPATPVGPHGERALPSWPVPYPPGRASTPNLNTAQATSVPPTPARTYRAIVDGDSRAVNAKLEAILKKLDALGGEKFEAMERELKKLRSEVDELRKDKD